MSKFDLPKQMENLGITSVSEDVTENVESVLAVLGSKIADNGVMHKLDGVKLDTDCVDLLKAMASAAEDDPDAFTPEGMGIGELLVDQRHLRSGYIVQPYAICYIVLAHCYSITPEAMEGVEVHTEQSQDGHGKTSRLFLTPEAAGVSGVLDGKLLISVTTDAGRNRTYVDMIFTMKTTYGEEGGERD